MSSPSLVPLASTSPVLPCRVAGVQVTATAPAAPRKAPAAAKPAAARANASVARNPVAAQQARAQGFALDLMQGGPDADDAQFREYA